MVTKQNCILCLFVKHVCAVFTFRVFILEASRWPNLFLLLNSGTSDGQENGLCPAYFDGTVSAQAGARFTALHPEGDHPEAHGHQHWWGPVMPVAMVVWLLWETASTRSSVRVHSHWARLPCTVQSNILPPPKPLPRHAAKISPGTTVLVRWIWLYSTIKSKFCLGGEYLYRLSTMEDDTDNTLGFSQQS